MYETYYGFREKPFTLIPDPEFLYLSKGHRAALSLLEYGLAGQAGFVAISGEVGSGKTTLVRRLMKTVGPGTTVGLITNTHRAFGELLEWISLAFDLDTRGKEKVELYKALVDFLIAQYAASDRTVLIIDEAQNLDVDHLEELRMLSNINADKDQVLQIMLVGQPELLATLKRPELRQFAQRISVDYHLEPLALSETLAYVGHRLSVAGGDPGLFDDSAAAAVHYFTEGVPRLINTLCDTALAYGFGEDRARIDLETVLNVVEDRKQGGLELFGGRDEDLRSEAFAEKIARMSREARAGQAAAAPRSAAPVREHAASAGDPGQTARAEPDPLEPDPAGPNPTGPDPIKTPRQALGEIGAARPRLEALEGATERDRVVPPKFLARGFGPSRRRSWWWHWD